MFQPGQSGNPAGKPKGTFSAQKIQFKEALNNLLDHAAPKMVDWLDQIAQEDPHKALIHISNFAEYLYPKLSRTENTNTNIDGVATLSTERLLQLERIVSRLTGSEALLIAPEPKKLSGDNAEAELAAINAEIKPVEQQSSVVSVVASQETQNESKTAKE